MTGLHIDSILKSFGDRQVLTDIFLSCEKGEIIGLLGRNGSGKSTLLKIIFGALPAQNKFIRVGKQKLNDIYDNRQFIGYLPQHHFLPNHLTIERIISLFCTNESGSILKSYELVIPLLKKKSKQLSGGELRFLEILLLIFSDKKYILLDEPFNGVAPIYKEVIKRLIKEQSQYKGFIITDHDYRNILDIATKIVLMVDGGTKPLKNREELKDWGYLGMNS